VFDDGLWLSAASLGEVMRVKATFPLDGLFVWHCHILEHEDNEMMRPYCVGDSAACEQHNSGN